MIQDLTKGDFFTYFERVFRLSLSEARKIEIVWWIGLNRRKLGERTFFLKLIRPVKADLITYLCHSRLLLYYFIPPFPFLAQLSLFFFFWVYFRSFSFSAINDCHHVIQKRSFTGTDSIYLDICVRYFIYMTIWIFSWKYCQHNSNSAGSKHFDEI